MIDVRASWERDVARKYGIDRSKDRALLDQVWEAKGPFDTPEEYDACVEDAWRWYKLREQTGGFEDVESSSGGRSFENSKVTLGEELDYEVHFDDATRLRAIALSEYLAKIVATDHRVMRLRKRICGGVRRTLSSEDALDFLGAHSAERHTNQGHNRVLDKDKLLRWPDGGPYGMDFIVSDDSLLEELKRVADYLAKHYPWKDYQAAHFILCGGVPQSATIMGGYSTSTNKGVHAHKFDRMTIKLEVEHWMPAEFVREAYCKIRDKALNDRDLLAQVSLQRSSLRNMEVFRFVVGQSYLDVKNTEQFLGRLELPEWPDLKDLWNAQLPQGDSRHYKEAKYFKRDFKRAQRAILGTDQGLPGIAGQPMTREELEEMHQNLLGSNRRMQDRVVERRKNEK